MGEKIIDTCVSLFVRIVFCMTAIFMINQYLMMKGSSIFVGLNWLSVAISGILGVPGVGMMYGIVFYQSL